MPKQFDELIELLESFKTHQISSLIDKITLNIFAGIKSPRFRKKAGCYFDSLPDLSTAKNEEDIKKILSDYYKKMPLKGFQTEPDNITQIKKLLNALYFAHGSFSKLEALELKKGYYEDVNTIWQLYDDTLDETYEASYLFTHLDVDVKEMFQNEIQALYSISENISQLKEQHADRTKLFTENITNYPLSYKIGETTGIALEQMKPSTGNLDYDFLTEFSASLPSYLDKITQFIQQYSSQLIAQEPSLNSAQLEELQKSALALLNDLESLRSKNRLFLSFKTLNYIHILNNILVLSKSSLEQIGHLSESSQDVIRDNLAQLKYQVFPELFGLVDKLEINFIQEAGSLSQPVMQKVKGLYDSLIYYAKKPVNFEEKGEELLTVEDSRFVSLRLDKIHQRIDKANKTLFKIKQIEEASIRFYNLLKAENKDKEFLALSQLPKEIKAQLIEDYKVMKPYMIHVNADKNTLIIDKLLEEKGIVGNTWDWLKGLVTSPGVSEDEVTHILLDTEAAFKELIEKKINTQNFLIDSNQDLIDAVIQSSDLTLFPYNDDVSTSEWIDKLPPPTFPPEQKHGMYLIDEEIPLQLAAEHNPRITFIGNKEFKTIENPQQLSADQSVIVYQWYKDKLERFQTAKAAYNKFHSLLEEINPISAQRLNFNQLDENNKQKLRDLYKQLRNYFQDGVSAERKNLAESFDKFLHPSSNEANTHLVPPILNDFNKLDNSLQPFFEDIEAKWYKKTQFFSKQAMRQLGKEEQNVFLMDEIRALRREGELTKNLLFSKEKDKKLIANPEQLTANQALTLHQWYKNKRNKLEVAQKAYNELLTLIEEQHQNILQPQFGAKLNPEISARCRKLYNVFQPYFIHCIPEDKRNEALKFDRYLVHIFSQKKLTEKIPSNNLFEQFKDHFQTYFTNQDLAWSSKSKSYLNLAQKQFNNENQQAKLMHDANADRAHYLISHTDYSTAIYEFRQSLHDLTKHFNASMQAELKVTPVKYFGINRESFDLLQPSEKNFFDEIFSDVPFPELNDKHLAAMQSKQVIAIKQIHNAFYHVEQLIRKLEELNDKSDKEVYVYYLIKAYSHINELTKIINSLSKDEHLKLIFNDLSEKAQTLQALIQEHSEPYQTAAEDVTPLNKNIQFNGLWYTLNAFSIIPKHIKSLRKGSMLTQHDLDKLHISAKKSTLGIESIIDSSDSYFKLFLQSPTMLHLFGKLKGQLNEFINTVHDTAINNLGNFNSSVFIPMQLEADLWEDRLGLDPGTFSAPLKKIIDEYYKGLLQPLNLPSKTHLDFICDKTPIQKRTDIAQENGREARKEKRQIDQKYTHFIKLHSLIEQYNKLSPSSSSTPLMSEIKKTYEEALPQLISLKKELNFEPNPKMEKEDLKFDEQLQIGIKAPTEQLNDIRALVKIGYAHYQGLIKTENMKENCSKEKIEYLEQLEEQQDKLNERFILDYTSQAFDMHCKELANRFIGLQRIHKEYSSKLEDHLAQFKTEIINKAKSQEDIHKSIKELLAKPISEFEEKHYKDYYQLDKIWVALDQLYNYFIINSVNENPNTINKIKSIIEELSEKATKEHEPIQNRIKEIQQKVKDPNFSRFILENKPLNYFSFAYLKSCALSLLRLLWLYTPEKEARLNELKEAIKEEPSLSTLSKRFGLFANNKKETKLEEVSPVPGPKHTS